jgi:hypothetical protein
VVGSLCYVLFRCVLEFLALRARSKECQELEIIVLRYEIAILRRTTRRPAITTVDRVLLAGRGQPTPASRALAILHRHTGDAAALAWTPRREAVDVRASRRSPADPA